MLQTDVNLARIAHSKSLADDGHFGGQAFVYRSRRHRRRLRLSTLLQLLEKRIDFIGVEVLVKVVVHLDARRSRTCAHALDFFEGESTARRNFLVSNPK